MEPAIRRTRRDYTLAFKLAVVEQVERGELTYTQAARRYGIQGSSTVLRWLREHGHQNWVAGAGARSQRTGVTPMDTPQPSPLTPEQRIRELEAQLREANQKAELFEAVIDILRNDYGVQVVKKPSGRPSRKSTSRG